MRVAPVLLAAAFLLAAPGVAAADVIFDPADADELAATLAEATADQDVCYGWNVQVDDATAGRSESIGSNLGAGQPIGGSCPSSVQLNVFITYTSESSESEDSASYDLVSSPPGLTRDDLDALELDTDSLTSDDPDVVIGKMVVAMPLLAADKGLADPIEAAPETGAAPSDAQLTDSPGSDWWRNSGGMLLWGVGLMLAGGVFAWWVVKSNRGRRRPGRFRPAPVEQVPPYIPDTVPAEFYEEQPTAPVRAQDPDLAPATKDKPESTSDPDPDPAAKEEPAEESISDDKPEPDEGAEPDAPAEPTPEPTASPSEEAGEEAAAEPPSTESAEPPSDEAKKTAPEAEPAADQKDKE